MREKKKENDFKVGQHTPLILDKSQKIKYKYIFDI